MTFPDLGELSPDNDLDLTIKLEDINTTTGTRTAITSGAATGFLSTSPDADAAAADASLSVAGVHVGGNPKYTGGANYESGTWLFHFDASALTAALLSEKFAKAPVYFIVTRTNAVRKVAQLTYAPASAGGS